MTGGKFVPKRGRRLARLFNMPLGTVGHIFDRIHRADPEVRLAAARFGLVELGLENLPTESAAFDLSEFRGRV